MRIRSFAIALAAFLTLSATAQTPVTTAFTYQGELLNAGNPATGPHDLRFRLYDSLGAQQGSTLCQNNVALTNGRFTVALDFGAQFDGEARFLEIDVRTDTGLDCLNAAGYTTLAPRQELTGTPYALGIRLPLLQTTATAADAINITQTGTGDAAQFNIVNPANVGEAVEARSDGSGDTVQSVMTGTGRAGFFQISNAANNTEVIHATTNSTGVGIAVRGAATADTGSNYGIYGSADSPQGHAVHGLATAGFGGYFQTNGTNGVGVYGFANATSGITEAVYGQNNSTSGRAVRGYATASSGTTYAGSFQALSTGGRAVFGEASAASGVTYGGYFQSLSPSGYGLYALNFDSMNEAFLGDDSSGVQGWQHAGSVNRGGVFGFSDLVDGNGVVGSASTGTVPYSIWGQNAGSGYAGFFSDRVHVSGTLTKSGGAFKIDHPLDPANKYLYHSFVESPDMLNIYNGNILTDASGDAEITLPDWFETVNGDFRYQLTVIGQFAQAIVSREIAGNKFAIRTDKPNVKVSWQVTGIRRDPWAQAHRIPLEEEKPAFEKGYYLHPDLYGAPQEQRIENAKAHADAMSD
jgi:hypothetical protein